MYLFCYFRCLKNSVIGSNRQKGSVIAQGVVPRLLQLLSNNNEGSNDRIRLEAAVTLGSLAKGTDQHILALIDLGVVTTLLQVLRSSVVEFSNNENVKVRNLLVESCLRCLRTIFQHPSAPVSSIFQDTELIPRLLQLSSVSINCQVYVAMILTTACKVIFIIFKIIQR